MNQDRKSTRRSWTVEEDAQLLQLINRHGTSGCWPKIAVSMDSRSGKQCRERYMNHLDPNTKKTAWTMEEDSVIKDMFSRLGTRWSLYIPYLPGRSDNAIKNRYHVIRKNNFECCQDIDPSPNYHLLPSRKRTLSDASEDTDVDTIGEESHVGQRIPPSLRPLKSPHTLTVEAQPPFWNNSPSSPAKSLSTRCDHDARNELDSDFEFDFDFDWSDAFLASEKNSEQQFEALRAEELLKPFDFSCYPILN